MKMPTVGITGLSRCNLPRETLFLKRIVAHSKLQRDMRTGARFLSNPHHKRNLPRGPPPLARLFQVLAGPPRLRATTRGLFQVLPYCLQSFAHGGQSIAFCQCNAPACARWHHASGHSDNRRAASLPIPRRWFAARFRLGPRRFWGRLRRLRCGRAGWC